jgi:hypothetical protein
MRRREGFRCRFATAEGRAPRGDPHVRVPERGVSLVVGDDRQQPAGKGYCPSTGIAPEL